MEGHAMSAADIDKHVRAYKIVFFALLALTGLTVMVSYLHVEVHLAIMIALAIAITKASLVALFFMHLISERQVIYLIMGLTIAFAVVLLLLPILTNLDPIRIAVHH